MIAFQKGFSFAGDDFTGVVAAVLSSAVYGIPYVLMKKISLNYSSFEMVFHQNFFSAILFTMLVFVLGVDFTFYQ